MIELTSSGLRPDDLFALKYAHDARLSPDGKRIACVISQTDGDEERFEIQLAELGSVSWRGLPYSGKATCRRGQKAAGPDSGPNLWPENPLP